MNDEESLDRIRKKNDELEKRNKELEDELKNNEQEINKWKEKYGKLKRKFDVLKNSILVLAAVKKTAEAGGIPSSKIFFKQNNQNGPKRPTGGQKGHKGHARKRPTPNVPPLIVQLTECPDCHNPLKEPMKKTAKRRIITDIPPPQPVFQEIMYPGYWCSQCKKVVYGTTPWLPSNIQFGITLASWISFQRMLGLTINKIRTSVYETYRIELSEATILKLEKWVAESLKGDYEKLKQEIEEAEVNHADETMFRINGDNGWLWIFCNLLVSVYEIADTRGKRVPQEILKDFDGILVSDAWRAYDTVNCSRHQMDLIHVNRWLERIELQRRIEPRSIRSSQPVKLTGKGRPHDEAIEFVDIVRHLMQKAVGFTERQPPPTSEERREKYDSLCLEMDSILTKKWKDRDINRICKELRRQADSLFTFVAVEGTPWHNNDAERGIRAGVLVRKISGGRRTWDGANVLKTLISIFETAKKREKNFMEIVKNKLSNSSMDVQSGVIIS